MLFGIYELTLVIISILLMINYAPNDISIIRKTMKNSFRIKVLVWVTVYGILYTILLMRRIVFILQWIYLTDPRYKQTNCNAFTFIVLNSFEFCWFIYGNTFFYNEQFLP